jgi:hypothetical protein
VRLSLSLIVIGVAILAALAVRYRWSWAAPFTRRWDRAHPWIGAYLRCAPGTFTYLFILIVTTWVLRSSTQDLRHALLTEHSTNLDHLRHDPITVLVSSAFWVTAPELALWLVCFPLVLAPAERWLGTMRTIVAFFVGHVGATLVTAATLALLINHHQLPRSLRDVVDVGSSYGFFCVAALFTYRLPHRWRWPWALTLLGGSIVLMAVREGFTDFGHFTAILIGLALYGLTLSPAVAQRDHWPIWRPPDVVVEAERARIEARAQLVQGVDPTLRRRAKRARGPER